MQWIKIPTRRKFVRIDMKFIKQISRNVAFRLFYDSFQGSTDISSLGQRACHMQHVIAPWYQHAQIIS